ncbi:MAG: tRNA 2-thiouridine(34) synthase MnmA [Erysipelothrix sp.]|nr:tRNA 2-thiouridine(34) synthase MnmA [Erysipelothrix sp.]
MKLRILVGLSGGVDSAVAAYLLKKAGHEVTCGFMRNWDSLANNDTAGNPSLNLEHCSQELDYNDAQLVAQKLGLPLIRVDFIEEYWDDVFTTFLEETKLGNTPNPDILCNRFIKFDKFWEYAKSLGFDWLATGHYARIIEKDGERLLGKAKDLTKDQSYFLVQMPKETLQHVIFPLGEVTKKEVREIALELDLNVATKKDSTGICFIGERHYKEFLTNYLSETEGDIIDIDTLKKVGQHQGVMYYTLGQRHGLNISAHKGPWFVVAKDPETNTLYVGKEASHPWLFSTGAKVSRINWFSKKEDLECMAKFRYRQADIPVSLKWLSEDSLEVTMLQEVSSVTPGQEAVFYLGDEVLGGGKIDVIFKNDIPLRQRLKEKLDAHTL